MHYDAPPRKSSAGTVITVFLVLGCLMLVGLATAFFGVMLFAREGRSRAMVQQAIAMERAEEARARARAEELSARAEQMGQRAATLAREHAAEATDAAATAELAKPDHSIRVADREITIQLDEAGKIQVDGAACETPQLNELLAGAVQGREDAIIVIIKADKRCLFESVAGVLAVCKELHLPHVRIAALSD